MNKKELAKAIIKNAGGRSNIIQSWHCTTRLRFNVRDKGKLKIKEIGELDGVMGAQFQSGQLQIIIGGEVPEVYSEIEKLVGEHNQFEDHSGGTKGNMIERIFDVISGIFTPLLTAIVGSGLLKGIMTVLVVTGLLDADGSTWQVLNAISDAVFHFLPFLVAFSAAKKFKTNPSLSLALAGILMYPTFMDYAAAGEVASLKFIGINIPMNNYASSVIPIILGVWLLSYVEKLAKKIVKKSLQAILVPLICLIITAPILLAFIAPLGSLVGIGLERVFSLLFLKAGPIAGALMGGLMPLIVITGMHFAFFPATFASFEQVGYDIMLLPMNLVANMAQSGATLGVFFKTKDSKMKQISLSAFLPAIFGTTEPAIYGVTMKLKKPFYASLAGGAVGGAIYGFFNVKALSFTAPGILALPTYIDNASSNFMFAAIGVAASFLTGFIVTLFLKFDTGSEQEAEQISEGNGGTKENGPEHIASPFTGAVKNLSQCPDQTFSTGVMGKGIGVVPDIGTVNAPFDGTITMTTPTCHAIGITSENGVELLIHIGIDTVKLQGEHFEYLVKEGDKVKKGEPLLKFDIEEIKNRGINLYSPVIVTNTTQFLDVVIAAKEHADVQAGEDDLLVVIS